MQSGEETGSVALAPADGIGGGGTQRLAQHVILNHEQWRIVEEGNYRYTCRASYHYLLFINGLRSFCFWQLFDTEHLLFGCGRCYRQSFLRDSLSTTYIKVFFTKLPP